MLTILLLFMALSCCAAILVCTLFLLNGGTLFASSGNVGFGVDLKALNATGEVPIIVTKAGKRALETVLKAGVIHGQGSNTSIKMRPPAFFPSTSCRVRFKVWFDDGFEWTGDKVGGKLGGFRIGTGESTGGNYSPTGSSLRLTYARDRAAVAYFYPMVRRASNSEMSWQELDQQQELVSQSFIAMGIHVFAPNRKPQLRFASGQWNDVELFCKLNTPGRYDGVIELAVNGDRRRLSSVRYRYDNSFKIEAFHLDVFAGGGSLDFAPSKDTKIWYTDFSFSSA